MRDLNKKLETSFNNSLRNKLGFSIWRCFGWRRFGSNIWSRLGNSLSDNLRDSVKNSLGQLLTKGDE